MFYLKEIHIEISETFIFLYLQTMCKLFRGKNLKLLKKRIKRVIPNQHLEKISTIPLYHLNNSHILLENITDKCQNNFDWNNSHQISHFQNGFENFVFPSNETHDRITDTPEDYSNSMKLNITKKTKFDIVFIKKYFEIWKTRANIGKIEKEVVPGKQEEEEKLNSFIEKLLNTKKVIHLNEYEKYEQNSEKSRSSYKNRFMVQKNIINSQKAKLDEQNKVIEELKLGIIREDILKSIENTKTNIREIFAGSSGKTKCKVPVVLVQENKFKIDIQKAPKIIQQMEERSLERARNREIILERKRLMEEMRQKILEEIIEKKRILEEEERKKTLQIMKEKRRTELEQERIRQQKRHIYEEKLIMAVEFHAKLLKQQCLRKLFNNLILSREKALTAIVHYEKKIQKNCLYSWMDLVESFYLVKSEIADAHFSYKILRKCMNLWKEARIESIRNMQAAEDLFDFRIISNVFIHWQRYVCKQIVLEMKNIKKAEKHHNRRMLFHCFYQWRSLKAVLELEKAKELKKQKWREKVWEILPDYKPPEDI